MARDRTKLIAGIEDAIYAAQDADGFDILSNGFPLYHLGHLADESVTLKTELLADREITGAELQKVMDVQVALDGLEFDKDEIAELERVFLASKGSLYLLGSVEAHELKGTALTLIPELVLDTKGRKRVQALARAYRSGFSVNNAGLLNIALDPALETSAPYRFRTFINARTRTANLKLCLLPEVGHFGDATKILDASLDRVVGTLYNTPTWSYPYLRFDGVNEYGDLGNALDDDGVSDYMIELWARVLGANGTVQRLISKAANDSTNGAGWSLFRHSSNTVQFKLADGAGNVTFGTTNLLQNIWAHIALAVDRNGTATLYVNGAAAGNGSVAALATGTNAIPLYLARNGSGYGNVDLGRIRGYNFGPGGLPANSATIIANHFNAEKAVYGL